MFKIHINDEKTDLPEDDIFYIVAKEGIFLKKKLGIMESIAPVKNVSTLQSIASYARMHINKIPSTTFAKIVDFFKKVYQQFHGEAIVLLFYNEETGKYRIVPPHQKVSGAALQYNRGVSIEGWTMIGTIHSHGSMSAFHSGTDHDDEETFDGLHITVGYVTNDKFSLSASIIANGFRAMVDPEDYINGIKKVSEIDKPVKQYLTKVYKYIDGKLQVDEAASKTTTGREFDKRYISLAPPSKSSCNPKWLSVVEKLTYTYHRPRGYAGFGNRQPFNYRGYGAHYDPHAWRQRYHQGKFQPHNLPVDKSKNLSLQASNQVIIDSTEEFGDITELYNAENTIPCLTCKFRGEKLLLEEDDEFAETLIFKCKLCNNMVTEDDLTENNLKCPNCNTDDHLEVLSDDELKSNYQKLSVDELSALQPDQEGFHICKECGTSFLRLASDFKCPFCNMLLDTDNVDDASSENFREEQIRADSGQYLGDHTDEAQEEIIRQASNPEQIPLPGQKEVSISDAHSPSIIKSMLKKVFGTKGN